MERESRRSISFPVIRLHQPIGDFYIGCMRATDLRDICWFDIRRIGHQENAIDDYVGIERQLSKSRVAQIKKYVDTIDATFPTGVIIAVEEICASIMTVEEPMIGVETLLSGRFGYMTLSNYPEPEDEHDRILYREIGRIIDGQHRVAGLEDYKSNDFEVNVVIFVGADIADQAGIFSNVNLAQTKVNRSLVYDLFALRETRSPQKTCHEIVVTLDREKESPFYHNIKRLGVATEGRFGETLSQATFVKALIRYISADPGTDEDLYKRGGKPTTADAKQAKTLIFRNFFLRGEDERIANIVWNYFDAIRTRWPEAWNATGTGFILKRTNGFNAFMRFLRLAYRNFTTTEQDVATDKFYQLFHRVTLRDVDFTTERYVPGTSGETALYNDLVDATGLGAE